MKRWISLSVLVLVLAVTTALPASAGRTWCASDPSVKLASGGVVHIKVAVPEGNRDDGFSLTIHAPPGSELRGNLGGINGTVELSNVESGGQQITADVVADFEVALHAKYRGDDLLAEVTDAELIILPPGEGSVTWFW